jgi:hypothetical protein
VEHLVTPSGTPGFRETQVERHCLAVGFMCEQVQMNKIKTRIIIVENKKQKKQKRKIKRRETRSGSDRCESKKRNRRINVIKKHHNSQAHAL